MQQDGSGCTLSEQSVSRSNHAHGVALPHHAAYLSWVAQTGMALTQSRTVAEVVDAIAAHLNAAPFFSRGYVLLVEDETLRVQREASFGNAPVLAPTLALDVGLCGQALEQKCVVSSSASGVSLTSWERMLATGSVLICAPFFGSRASGVIVAALSDNTVDDEDVCACLQAAATLTGATLNRAAECETQLHDRMRQIDQVHTERLALVGRLTAALAHEINNPLQAIANTLHLLQHRPLNDEKRRRYLAMAQRETESVIVGVRRMLDLYRSSEQGKRPVSLRQVLDQALQQAADVLRERAIDLHCELTPADLRVPGFAGHLRYACYNLILNGVYAMPHGGQLTIRTYQQIDTNASLAIVEFADTGAPVDDADLYRLFEPDGPVRGETNGIELPLSYSIIEQHNGTLTVHRHADEMVFRVSLPIVNSYP